MKRDPPFNPEPEAENFVEPGGRFLCESAGVAGGTSDSIIVQSLKLYMPQIYCACAHFLTIPRKQMEARLGGPPVIRDHVRFAHSPRPRGDAVGELECESVELHSG